MGASASVDNSALCSQAEFPESDGESEYDSDDEENSTHHFLLNEFCDRIESQSLDDYTRDALKGISDGITRIEDSDAENRKSIHEIACDIFGAVEMKLEHNRFIRTFCEIFERNDHICDSDGVVKHGDIYDVFPSSAMNEQTKDTLRNLSEIAHKLQSRFHNSTKKQDHPIQVNLGLLRLYVSYQAMVAFKESSTSPRTHHSISETFIAETKYFLRFAIDVYSSLGISYDDKLLDRGKENDKLAIKVRVPRHVVFLDHFTKSIVIAIRGTNSVADIITDVQMDTIPFLQTTEDASLIKDKGTENIKIICAHRGMAESAQEMLAPVLIAIRDAHTRHEGRYRDYKIVMTGHSLGAGTGCLLAMLVASHSSLPVKTFAFAPPPAVSREAYFPDDAVWAITADKTNAKQSLAPSAVKDLPVAAPRSQCIIHSFVHHNDIVPRISYVELMNMLDSVESIDTLPWNPTDRMLMLLRGSLTEAEVASMQLVLAGLQYNRRAEVELVVPGQVYWLQPFKDRIAVGSSSTERGKESGEKTAKQRRWKTKYQVHQLDDARKLFNGHFYTGDSMINDHSLAPYMKAVRKVISC
jgi:hypothetical protein